MSIPFLLDVCELVYMHRLRNKIKSQVKAMQQILEKTQFLDSLMENLESLQSFSVDIESGKQDAIFDQLQEACLCCKPSSDEYSERLRSARNNNGTIEGQLAYARLCLEPIRASEREWQSRPEIERLCR